MRVLLISHTCQSAREGQPKAELLGRMPGVDLCVLTPDRWRHYGAWRAAEVPEDCSFDLRVGRVSLPWMAGAQNYLHWYPELRKVLREFRPDVIDLWEEPWGAVSAHVCWLRDRMLPDAKVVSETEQNINKTLPPPFEQFRRYVLRRADYLVGRSAEAVEVARAKGYAGPATVVPNAFDDTLFRPLDRAACRRELGLSGFVVGYVGRLVEEKGLADLLDAVALCPQDVNLITVGDGPLRAELETRSAARDLSDRARFERGRPLERLAELMNAVDVLVLPSRTTRRWKEQFGRVLIEAHGCRTPVIGTRSGAIPDVVGDGGLLVPERDPTELAKAIRRLRDDAALSQSLATAGWTEALRRYTWQRVAERMHEVYQQVLAAPARLPKHAVSVSITAS